MVAQFRPGFVASNIDRLEVRQLVSRNENVIDMKWPMCVAVKIDRWARFNALRFTEILVVPANQTTLSENFYHFLVIPYLPFGVPYRIAVQISCEDHGLPAEPFGMRHQSLIDLPDVVVSFPDPRTTSPDRKQSERRGPLTRASGLEYSAERRGH
jgi:hypothetical protein